MNCFLKYIYNIHIRKGIIKLNFENNCGSFTHIGLKLFFVHFHFTWYKTKKEVFYL